jgi:ribosomal 30S subunit maturation factor RimM
VDGSVVGTVVRVEGSLGDSRLVVEAPQGEVLIPLVQPICQHVEPDVKRIVIAPPEGLLDVNVTDAQQANRPSQK